MAAPPPENRPVAIMEERSGKMEEWRGRGLEGEKGCRRRRSARGGGVERRGGGVEWIGWRDGGVEGCRDGGVDNGSGGGVEAWKSVEVERSSGKSVVLTGVQVEFWF